MPFTPETTKAMARAILEHATAYEWSVQGLGMYRLMLTPDKVFRMHVWDQRARRPNVSTILTHPRRWFSSLVVSGRMVDRVWCVSPKKGPMCIVSEDGKPFRAQKIVWGPGGCATGEVDLVYAEVKYERAYGAGESYWHATEQYHESIPDDGTVTVVEREIVGDTEHAYVLFHQGEEWISAEPRRATDEEVAAMAAMTLEKF